MSIRSEVQTLSKFLLQYCFTAVSMCLVSVCSVRLNVILVPVVIIQMIAQTEADLWFITY